MLHNPSRMSLEGFTALDVPGRCVRFSELEAMTSLIPSRMSLEGLTVLDVPGRCVCFGEQRPQPRSTLPGCPWKGSTPWMSQGDAFTVGEQRV